MHSATLVLIPGLMCDRTVWSDVLPHLGEWAPRATVPDHGLCDSLSGMAQQILDTTTGPLALVGHSMGGRIAMEMVRMAPQRVCHLTLMDTGHLPRPAGPEGEAEAAKRHALLEIAEQQGVAAMARTWAQGMVHPDRLKDAPLMEAIVAMFARKTPQHFAGQIRALLARPDASPTLQNIRGPVHLVCGAQDTWSPVSQHQAMADLLAQPVLSVIPDAGHMAPMERPQAVAQVLLAGLSSAP